MCSGAARPGEEFWARGVSAAPMSALKTTAPSCVRALTWPDRGAAASAVCSASGGSWRSCAVPSSAPVAGV